MANQIQAIHDRAIEAAGRFKKAEADLIEIIQLADRERIYFHFECKSLFDYVTRILGLAEGTAYNLITVARKAVEVPALKDAIRDRGLTVSKARKLSAVLTPENHEEWIQIAIDLPSRKLEEEVAIVLNPNRAKTIGLHLDIPREIYESLKRAQDLECQRQKTSVSLEETLAVLLDTYLERQDPVRKAERATSTHRTESIQLVTGRVNKPRKAIPALSAHEVHLRDQGQCTYRESKTGERRTERKWIDLHHIQPRSRGGSHSPRNLITLCSGHHRLRHFRDIK